MNALGEWITKAADELEDLFARGRLGEHEFRRAALKIGMGMARVERAIGKRRGRYSLVLKEERIPAYREIERRCEKLAASPGATSLAVRIAQARNLLAGDTRVGDVYKAVAYLVTGLSQLDIEELDE